MALTLSRIDRLYRHYDVSAPLPLGGEASISGVAVALLPPRATPTAATEWTTVAYAEGTATILLAGPDADSTGALVVSGNADLWMKVTDTPEVDAERVERINVLDGGTTASLPAPGVASVNGQTGAVVLPTAQDSTVFHLDDHGGDPTGVADSAAAFNAALAAMPTVTRGATTYPVGTLKLGAGTYKLGAAAETNNIGPYVNVIGAGQAATTISYVGSGRALYMHDPEIPPKFVNIAAWSGRIDGFTVDGSGAAAGAMGLDYGDTEGGVLGPSLLIRDFTGAGSYGLYLSNRYWWTENVHGRVSVFGCTTNVGIDGTRGPGANSYNSFEYNDLTLKIYMLPNQRGVALENGAWFGNGSLKIRANCALSSTPQTTGALLTLTGQSAAGHLNANEFSWINGSHLDIQAETNSSTEYGSTYGPKTIAMGDNNQNRIIGTVGSWAFDGPGWTPFDTTGWTRSNIQHIGTVVGDTSLQPSTSHRGPTIIGPLARTAGYVTPGGQVRVPSGDFHRITLTQNSTVELINSFGAPHEMILAITQASTGGPFTVGWQFNGSPTLSSPTIVWSGGTTPRITTTAGATDVFKLVTLDGITWYGSRLSSKTNEATSTAKSARLYAPSGQSLPSGATTALTGLTQEFNDDGDFFTVDASAGTITVKRAGQYLASWAVRTLGGAAGKRFSSIQINDSDRGKHGVNSVGGGSVADITGLSAPIKMSANDVVRLAMYVDGGTSATVTGNVPYDTGFSLTYLGT